MSIDIKNKAIIAAWAVYYGKTAPQPPRGVDCVEWEKMVQKIIREIDENS